MKDIKIIELCEKVLEISAIYEYNSNSYDATKCPFCKEWEYGSNGSMNTIEHSEDCGWLLATNISKENKNERN